MREKPRDKENIFCGPLNFGVSTVFLTLFCQFLVQLFLTYIRSVFRFIGCDAEMNLVNRLFMVRETFFNVP